MDIVIETPQVDIDIQAIVDILTQRIAHLELNNAAQQAHIAALLARLVIYQEAEMAQTNVPDETEQPDAQDTEGQDISTESEAIPPEQE